MQSGSPSRRRGIVSLRCGVQHYAWGAKDAIPELLGISNADERPFAELWIGAHPDLPAQVVTDGTIPLDRYIEDDPDGILGPHASRRFDGQLPFLLKILSAAEPLSIQVHPDASQALEGFNRENEEAIPAHDPRRNYHDPYHKPELLCALTPFYALRGFRPLHDIRETLAAIPELAGLAPDFEPDESGLAQWYRGVMKLGQDQVDEILLPLVRRLAAESLRVPFRKDQPEYWVLRAHEAFSTDGHADRGLFSIFLLNLLRLEPGQAIFLPAGELHAYLRGTGVEIMANSNNVLRGGLTPKHVDVDELLRIGVFRGARPQILQSVPRPSEPTVCFEPPVDEFRLCRTLLEPGQTLTRPAEHGVELAIVLRGGVIASWSEGGSHWFPRGACYLVPFRLGYTLSADRHTELFTATIPASPANEYSER